MNHKAIYALYSKVKYINDELGCFDATGNKIKIDVDKVKKWKDPDQYKIDRENSYPSIEDQLDEIRKLKKELELRDCGSEKEAKARGLI